MINDRVYDITDFIGQHPGGAVILTVAGTDATDFFMELHRVTIQQLARISHLSETRALTRACLCPAPSY